MWAYLVGPFVSVLSQRWHECIAPNDQIDWEPATLLSGVAEFLAALTALVYGNSYSVTHEVQQVIFSTVKAHPQASIPGNRVGFAGLVLVALHPLTWVIVGFGIEGVVRVVGNHSRHFPALCVGPTHPVSLAAEHEPKERFEIKWSRCDLH